MKITAVYGAAALLCSSLLPAAIAGQARAESGQSSEIKRPAQNPKPCIGYAQITDLATGTIEEIWGAADNRGCAPGATIIAGEVGVITQKNIPTGSLPFVADCCALPADDILTQTVVNADTECPPEHIATGSALYTDKCPACPRPLRCTKINTVRYQLGPPQPGAYWGFGTTFWRNTTRYQRSELPAAIRYAVGRHDRFDYRAQGCIGEPFGSLLTARTGRRTCAALKFAELQYRGLPGDPPRGTPVKMFPDCSAVLNYTSPEPQCVSTQQNPEAQ